LSAQVQHCFAIAAPGLEPIVSAEIAALGASTTIVGGGVEFDASRDLLYRCNLELRVASRVLVRIASFRARTFFELERHARDIPWRAFLQRGSAVSLRVSSSKSKLYHEGAIEQRLMSAIQEKIGDITSSRARDDEDTCDEAQMFVVRFLRDECTVSADSSGALLHLRGYRQAVAKAPLRETLAAALIAGSQWSGATPLIDPMCGAGTIPIEAALIARRIAPGLANAARTPRRYAFQHWPDYDDSSWTSIVAAARTRILPTSPVAIVGSDRDAGAVEAALSNAARAGVNDDVVFTKAALSAAPLPAPDAWLVTNPPYGVRVGGGDQRNLAAALGNLVREALPYGRAALITPDTAIGRHARLRLETLFDTRNGGIAVRAMATPLPATAHST
jgi:putative N6-adenine-specific DNA methylase